MDSPPKIQREPLSDGSPQIQAARKSHCNIDNSGRNFQQAVVANEQLVSAANHVLSLGERASIEFLRDIARGRDVLATCADFSRIPVSTYRALMASMSAPVSGVPS